MDANLVLEYLKVLLSAPPIVGLVILAFIVVFRTNIAALIDRVKKLNWPGGKAEFGSQQRQDQIAATTAARPPTAAADQVKLPDTIPLTKEQAQQIAQRLQSEQANAALWEFRYLNLFLARSTQEVLAWLAFQQPMVRHHFDNLLQTGIPDAKERAAIYAALQSHHLIDVSGDLIQVSPKGRQYLEWRGPLPPLPGGTVT